MTTIIHLSDMHIGTEDKKMLPVLVDIINKLNSEVIVISGDFTQRAKIPQYKIARDFIKQLTCKNILSVPGNHDIALYRIFERFLMPFDKYKKYISNNINPSFCNNDVAIIGINSATPYTIQDGMVTDEQLKIMHDFFSKTAVMNRIVVMHHNMIRPEYHKVILNLETVIQALAESRVNYILAGHLHDVCIERIERDYIDYNMYAITAGTALSSRLRTQPNSFNYMTIENNEFNIKVYCRHGDQYLPQDIACFI